MMIANDQNLKFYDQESVQNIIDMQFERTYKAGLFLFTIYNLFFGFPLTLYIIHMENIKHSTSTPSGDKLESLNEDPLSKFYMSIALIGVIPFVLIEFIQIKQKGPKTYLTDAWNWIDILYLITFFKICYFHFNYELIKKEGRFEKETKVFMVIFLFCKVNILAQIFDSFRSFSVYLIKAIEDSMPFTRVYYAFIIFVAIGYTALDVDTL